MAQNPNWHYIDDTRLQQMIKLLDLILAVSTLSILGKTGLSALTLAIGEVGWVLTGEVLVHPIAKSSIAAIAVNFFMPMYSSKC